VLPQHAKSNHQRIFAALLSQELQQHRLLLHEQYGPNGVNNLYDPLAHQHELQVRFHPREFLEQQHLLQLKLRLAVA
jgi:hypothetical protein